MKPPEIAEDELVRLYAEGDVNAYNLLIRPISYDLMGLCLFLMKDRSEAEDCYQEALTRIWQCAHQYTRNENFRGWVFTIATRLCLNQLRKMGRSREELADFDDPMTDIRVATSGERAAKASEEREKLANLAVLEYCLDRLSEKFRNVLVLMYTEGLSIKEIADALGISESAVKARAMRARIQMVECVGRNS